MACVGRTKQCTIVPSNHYGPIPGVPVGSLWKFRVQVSSCKLESWIMLLNELSYVLLHVATYAVPTWYKGCCGHMRQWPAMMFELIGFSRSVNLVSTGHTLLGFMAGAMMAPTLWSWQEATRMMWYAVSLCSYFIWVTRAVQLIEIAVWPTALCRHNYVKGEMCMSIYHFNTNTVVLQICPNLCHIDFKTDLEKQLYLIHMLQKITLQSFSWGSCSSGSRVGLLSIRKSVVWSPATRSA